MIVGMNLLPHQINSSTIKILMSLRPRFRGQIDLKMRHLENIIGVATVSIMYI
jgi:hypothetical protein